MRKDKMTQTDSMKFRILKKDHEKALQAFPKILQYQQAHPEIYYYTRSRSYFMDAEDNPDYEIWMFIDEYDNREKYWDSLQNAMKNDPASAENYRNFLTLMIPGSATESGSAAGLRHEVWTEMEELRVEFNR
jgi:hypothetical protein